MKLFVGLGNPGAQYAGNRHNIGFVVVEHLAQAHGFSPWRKAHHGLVAEGRLGGEKVILLKPQTFMNLSGQAVQAAAAFYKIAPPDIVVFHDELDLAPGKLRLKTGGGHAGHNGLRSIHAHLGEGYGRVRIGIGHPGHKDAVAAYVLHDFAKADRDWIEALTQGVAEGAEALAQGDGARFQTLVAQRLSPPRNAGAAGPAPGGEAPAPRSAPKPAPAPAPIPAPQTAPPPAASPGPLPATPPGEAAAKSPWQRLKDHFR